MESLSVGAIVNSVVIAGYATVAAWRGYVRRRAYWSRGSWLGLGVTMLVSVALVGFGLAFSLAVDHREAWVGASHSGTRAAWVAVAMGCLLGGSVLGAVTMGWFATGKPWRPFPFFGGRRTAVTSPDTDEPQRAAPPGKEAGSYTERD